MPDSAPRLAVLALVVAMTVWGSTFVVTKSVLDEAGPFAVAVLRFGVGLLVLLSFAYRRGFRWNHALRYVPASAAALYVNTVPVMGLGFALLFGGRVGAAQLVGGALASRGCC